jgi:uncharacterized membrane protein YeaQ/YmgE (transglycosylase-associated protein family)
MAPDLLIPQAGRGDHAPQEDRMDLIITLIIGGVIGWIASIVMKSNAQMGMIANVIIGIVGSFLGMWAAGAMGSAPDGPAKYVVSLLGAMVLIAIVRALGLFGGRHRTV